MQQLAFIIVALLNLSVQAFNMRSRGAGLRMSADVDRLLGKVAQQKLLTQTAQLGVLSKLDKAGVKLTTLAPLIKQADELGALSLVEGKGEQLLPLINKAVDLAPLLLPLTKGLIQGGPTPLIALAIVSLASALAVVGLIPDDSVSNVALQTLIAVPLGAIVPGACGVGAAILGKLK